MHAGGRLLAPTRRLRQNLASPHPLRPKQRPDWRIERMTTDKPSWSLTGVVLVACNCDYGCPCNFNALPTHGKCEGGWTWHVQHGSFDGVSLDGLNFSVYVNWPGAIHGGNGEAVILVDVRADDRQRQAIATLVRGEVGRSEERRVGKEC